MDSRTSNAQTEREKAIIDYLFNAIQLNKRKPQEFTRVFATNEVRNINESAVAPITDYLASLRGVIADAVFRIEEPILTEKTIDELKKICQSVLNDFQDKIQMEKIWERVELENGLDIEKQEINKKSIEDNIKDSFLFEAFRQMLSSYTDTQSKEYKILELLIKTREIIQKQLDNSSENIQKIILTAWTIGSTSSPSPFMSGIKILTEFANVKQDQTTHNHPTRMLEDAFINISRSREYRYLGKIGQDYLENAIHNIIARFKESGRPDKDKILLAVIEGSKMLDIEIKQNILPAEVLAKASLSAKENLSTKRSLPVGSLSTQKEVENEAKPKKFLDRFRRKGTEGTVKVGFFKRLREKMTKKKSSAVQNAPTMKK